MGIVHNLRRVRHNCRLISGHRAECHGTGVERVRTIRTNERIKLCVRQRDRGDPVIRNLLTLSQHSGFCSTAVRHRANCDGIISNRII